MKTFFLSFCICSQIIHGAFPTLAFTVASVRCNITLSAFRSSASACSMDMNHCCKLSTPSWKSWAMGKMSSRLALLSSNKCQLECCHTLKQAKCSWRRKKMLTFAQPLVAKPPTSVSEWKAWPLPSPPPLPDGPPPAEVPPASWSPYYASDLLGVSAKAVWEQINQYMIKSKWFNINTLALLMAACSSCSLILSLKGSWPEK